MSPPQKKNDKNNIKIEKLKIKFLQVTNLRQYVSHDELSTTTPYSQRTQSNWIDFFCSLVKPTEAQVVSVREGGEGTGDRQAAAAARSDEGRGQMAADGAALVSEDTAGHKKYTIRAGRLYRAECRSKGSRPLAAIEWYLLKRNRRYDVGRSAANGTADGPVPSVQPGEKRGGASMVVESTVASVVETQQVSVRREIRQFSW